MRKEQFASLACGISHCWQSSDWNVMGRKLLIIETIQEPLFLHKFENKQVIYFLPDDSFEKFMGFVKAFRWDLTDHVSIAQSDCSQGQALMRGPTHFSMESPWDVPRLSRPLYASLHVGASKCEPCSIPGQNPSGICAVSSLNPHMTMPSCMRGTLPAP